MHFIFTDPQKNINFNNLENLDLPGTFATFAPTINMDTTRGGFGAGTVAYGATHQIKPTATASLAWVKGNHSYKFGAEMRVESHPSTVYTPGNGSFFFNAAETSDPYLLQDGNTGHPYASFLLGMIHNGEIGMPNRFHLGKHSIAFFAQDSWKITPKLTLDYGLRWDYPDDTARDTRPHAELGSYPAQSQLWQCPRGSDVQKEPCRYIIRMRGGRDWV